MVLESAQILSTVNRTHGLPAPYRPTHVNHPCVKWAHAPVHRRWLERHFRALLEEYTFRYGKIHACSRAMDELVLGEPENDLKGHLMRSEGLVLDEDDQDSPAEFVQAMPEQHRVPGDPVAAYRRYYVAEKARFARWAKGRKAPEWWRELHALSSIA